MDPFNPFSGAMNQMWQVNSANQNASLQLAALQNAMDQLNAQLSAAQSMQGKALNQGQQNEALGILGNLANTKQLGGIYSNMFSGLGNALGGMFNGMGNMFGGMFGGGGGGGFGAPLNMQSNSGAGISFGGGGGGGMGGGGGQGGGGAAGNPATYDTTWMHNNISPLYNGFGTPLGTAGRGPMTAQAAGGYSIPQGFSRAYGPGSTPPTAMDPVQGLMSYLNGGGGGGGFGGGGVI